MTWWTTRESTPTGANTPDLQPASCPANRIDVAAMTHSRYHSCRHESSNAQSRLMNRSERRAARKHGGGRTTEPFATAVRCHQAGVLVEAERHYGHVLTIDPNHL